MGPLDELVGELRVDADALAFLGDADDREVAELLRAVRSARARREQELRVAVDRSLSFVPRLLRGRIRSLLGAGGRG